MTSKVSTMSPGLSQLAFLALLVWSVDALFVQLQMLVLHSTPVPNIAVKMVFSAFLFAGAFSQLLAGVTNPMPKRLMSVWKVFILFLMIETVYLTVGCGNPLDYVVFSYNAYYFGILVLPLFFISTAR